MDIHPQIEPTSTARLLKCMSLAIDETKLLRSINKSKLMVKQLEAEYPFHSGPTCFIFFHGEI